MQLLLLLSALLSAMTGGLAPAGGEVVRVDQAEAQLIAPAVAPQSASAEAKRLSARCVPASRAVETASPIQRGVVEPAPLASVCLIE